jgi:hypothetical protein
LLRPSLTAPAQLGAFQPVHGEERPLDPQFRAHRQEGEWFKLCPEISQFIRRHATSDSDSPQALFQVMIDDDVPDIIATIAEEWGISFAACTQRLLAAGISRYSICGIRSNDHRA